MSRLARIRRHVFAALALPTIASAGWACAEGSSEDDATSATGGSTLTLSSSSSGSGGMGGIGVGVGAGGGGGNEVCTSTSASAAPVPLDLVVVVDRSGSMQGEKWTGTKSALSKFFEDPASAGISAGLVYFPTVKPFMPVCEDTSYKLLDVPIVSLPDNAFTLTNSLPANATGGSTPTFAALHGALMAATAYQDAHPTHKVHVVLATDGDPYGCEDVTIDAIAEVAKNALAYNGVRTYVIGVEGSIIANLDDIAYAGGTTAAYDITQDISLFSATMAEIRTSALGCEFGIPEAPSGMELVPDFVNFTYTPGGTDMPVTVPRADDLADCGDQPGWYYDDNTNPKKIFLCPASCNTVQNDEQAEVAVAFGCQSVLN